MSVFTVDLKNQPGEPARLWRPAAVMARRCGIPPSVATDLRPRPPGTSGPGQPPGRPADMKISARRNRKLDRTHCLANTLSPAKLRSPVVAG